MRSVLATPSVGLACFMSGEPHWFCHHLGLGETIGYSTRLSLNNTTLYKTQLSTFTNAVYIALMGDPTLRLDPVSPVPWVTANAAADGVHLSWGPPSDPIVGFNLYRASSATGPFSRLNASTLINTSFVDSAAAPGTNTYMVRAVALTTTPSGSYYNLSQGAFVTVTVNASASPIVLNVVHTGNNIRFSWNTQAGQSYHVESTSAFNPTNWGDISGSLIAGTNSLSWTELITGAPSRKFYRVASP